MATVTKRELVLKLSNELGLTQQRVQEILELAIEAIADALASGDSVVVRNFGAFHVREMRGKVGRNPKDPEKSVKVPPRAVVKFKPSQSLKDKVSGVLPVLRERGKGRREAAG